MSTDTAMKIISMVEGCAIWAALFIAFYFITKASGMKNSLPKEVKSRLATLSHSVESFKGMLSDSKPDSEKTITKAFSKLNHAQRMCTKIFAVYVYDHPLSVTAQRALDTLVEIREKCKKISKAMANSDMKDMSGVISVLPEINSLIEKANSQLEFVIKEEDGEKYLKA